MDIIINIDNIHAMDMDGVITEEICIIGIDGIIIIIDMDMFTDGIVIVNLGR